MARQPGIHWHVRDQVWRASIGEAYTDRGGRNRRKEVSLRYPEGGLIPRSDRKAALEALAAALVHAKPVSARAGGPTIAQVADWWLVWMDRRVQADLTAKRTYEGHQEMLSWFLGFQQGGYASRSLDSFDAIDLERIVIQWKTSGKSAGYVNRLIGTVGALFSWASKRVADRGFDAAGSPLPARLIAVNPMAGFPREQAPASPERYASRAETAAFLRWIWSRARSERMSGHRPSRDNRAAQHWNRLTVLMVRLILWTGCRPSEACAARWADLDWSKGTITLAKHKTARKTGRRRVIYLTPTLVRALRRVYESERRHPEYLFAHRPGRRERQPETAGKPWSPAGLALRIRRWRTAAIADGVPLAGFGANRWHLYRLRHTRASDGLMNGLPEAQVAEVLGTSAAMVRRTYGHLLDESVRRAADIMTMTRAIN